MSRIGRSEREIEDFVLEQMKAEGLLDDILIPG